MEGIERESLCEKIVGLWGKEWTAKEIAEELGLTAQSVYNRARKLVRQGRLRSRKNAPKKNALYRHPQSRRFQTIVAMKKMARL